MRATRWIRCVAAYAICVVAGCAPREEVGRFVLVDGTADTKGASPPAALVLDTKTGRLCYAVVQSMDFKPIEDWLCDRSSAEATEIETRAFIDSVVRTKP